MPLEADRPVHERRTSWPTIITSSPIVFTTGRRRAGCSVTASTKRSTEGERLLLALLLGEAGVAGEVGERDRHAHAAEVELLVVQVDLHVADHVLLDEVLEEALVDVVHQRRGERQQVAREALHLLGHLEARHPLAHQRLVDVEVEQAHLGVGDLRQRLPVDAARAGGRRRAGSRRRETDAT